MVQELKIPESGESIQEVQIGQWLKAEGQWVQRDETVVELETDKASLDLPAPVAGLLTKILKENGQEAEIGETIALIDPDAPPPKSSAPQAEPGQLPPPQMIMPAAQRLLREHGLQGRQVTATGPGGRLLKEDVLRHVAEQSPAAEPEPRLPSGGPAPAPTPGPAAAEPDQLHATAPRQEEVVPLTLIRRRIADTLVRAQQEAALLTTFNEVDMSAVIELRQRYQDRFREKYDVKLGFMSFFVKAAVTALQELPVLNAEIREKDVVYRNYYDIGVAIGGGKGLVVPALRDAQRLSFAQIEQQILDFATRAAANKIRPEELQGGTFTITNGGVYGSLLSTPIVNPPQSGVLGLHTIQERPVARDGQVVIRPMMYVALTYDHRIVDGREAVTFLKRVQQYVEQPASMLLEV